MGLANKATFYPYPARGEGVLITGASLTVTTGATATTDFDEDFVSKVTFDIQDQPVRVRWDGVSPTSTVGHYLPANTAYTWSTPMWNAAEFIRASDSTGNAIIFASPLQE